MQHEVTIDIDAPPDEVWAVLLDVDRWPEWTDSVTAAEWVDPGAPAVGRRARLTQPRLVPAVWKVTGLERGRSFDWRSRALGVTTEATHRIDATPAGGSQVRLGIRQTGPLGWLAGLLFGRLARRYVQMEAEGLKRRAEAQHRERDQASDV